MRISLQDLKDMMKQAGMDPAYVDNLTGDVSLKAQGFDSVYYPALLLGIKEKWGFELPIADYPADASLDWLAGYLSAKTK